MAPPCPLSRRVPQDVWENIVALRPRDRDARSPTAAAFMIGTGLEGIGLWIVPGEEEYFCWRDVCPRCNVRRRHCLWWFLAGEFERPAECNACFWNRRGLHRLNSEFLRPYLGE